jgi:Leucine-rich repeat (LRR) protein
MRKYIEIENSKPDPSIELTSKNLTDLSVLDGLTHPEAVKTLNLWGNKLANIEQLKKFRGLG